jgi:hypothetical protein
MTTRTITLFTLLAACGSPGGSSTENEVISRVELAFRLNGAGDATTFRFDDPDGDGGAAGTSDPINIAPGSYQVSVSFLNALETPPEDITVEVRDEGVEHQVFFAGSAVVGPATTNTTGPLMHSYADEDINHLPLGLTNTVVATPGTGELVITLRHMPPEEPPEKDADTASSVATGGFAAIGGSTDAQVMFNVTVQ